MSLISSIRKWPWMSKLTRGYFRVSFLKCYQKRGSQKACPLFNDILLLIVWNLLMVNVMVIENLNNVYEPVIISGNPCSCHHIYNGVLKMHGMYCPLREVDVHSINTHVENQVLNNVTTTVYDRENGCSNNVECTECGRWSSHADYGAQHHKITSTYKALLSSKYSMDGINVNMDKSVDNRVGEYCTSCPVYHRTGRWDTSYENEFYNYYRVYKSPGHGHCLLHSTAHS